MGRLSRIHRCVTRRRLIEALGAAMTFGGILLAALAAVDVVAYARFMHSLLFR
jgi:acyl-CoA thioesterase